MSADLVPLLRLEARLLVRHGIVAAVAVVAATWSGLLAAVPAGLRTDLLAPVLYLDAGIVGLLFVGGLVLLERSHGSLEALAVSPVRPAAYVAARVGWLTVLALAASLVIVAVARPPAIAPAPLVTGVALLCVPVLLVALVVATRTTTVTDYLFRLQVPLLPAALPLAALAGWVPDAVGWLSPTHGPLLLLQAGVGGPPPGPVATTAAVVVPIVTAVGLARIAVRRTAEDLWRRGGQP
ncbi:fluoroquinolone export ABC transporter permease subunit [Egicoccus halophilus]|uniref:Fluoroquinolone transport system permease protein n=1 Tax=Egicoccus halophilus TaxID=1670830 RepID=A0A8J3EWR1_9ACTN|nr:hypothetical protein [Egicoccus halophilus]GGI04210.1 hypothetical protein GCM10011354_07970 [Egicoccus halophilus]